VPGAVDPVGVATFGAQVEATAGPVEHAVDLLAVLVGQLSGTGRAAAEGLLGPADELAHLAVDAELLEPGADPLREWWLRCPVPGGPGRFVRWLVVAAHAPTLASRGASGPAPEGGPELGAGCQTREMTAFTVRNRSSATVHAKPARVWDALTDPDLLPRLTPYLREIDADGDRWVWHLARVPVLGVGIAPSFTELMTFDRHSRITFTHDPELPQERAGVDGTYRLAPAGGGTDVAIDLAITVDLPFPSMARPAVRTAMRGVVMAMGSRFSANLVRHLGSSSTPSGVPS
jgi:carbon monoxide dehydrogenase subunit G